MKKNKMMRLASMLLVVTLLSTCIISGTFAKYVTTDSASDTARVAKWGMTVSAGGSLFAENYYPFSTEETSNQISAVAKYSADSSNGENIVAPGTKNDVGVTLSVKGTPEVASVTTVEIEDIDDDHKKWTHDIYLNVGTYGVMVPAAGVNEDNYEDYYIKEDGKYYPASTYDDTVTYYSLHDEVTLEEKYLPVTWTLNLYNAENDQMTSQEFKDVMALQTAIKNYFSTPEGSQNDPNVTVHKACTVTWEWPFEGNNAADTILGNLMAGKMGSTNEVVQTFNDGYWSTSVYPGAHYNTEIGFGLQITVTQVD